MEDPSPTRQEPEGPEATPPGNVEATEPAAAEGEAPVEAAAALPPEGEAPVGAAPAAPPESAPPPVDEPALPVIPPDSGSGEGPPKEEGEGGRRTLAIAALLIVGALVLLWLFMRGGDGASEEGAATPEPPAAATELVEATAPAPATEMPIVPTYAPPPGPPVAAIDAPASGTVGTPVTFSGARSSGESPIVSYIWDFGDGSRAGGVEVSHSYDLAGRFQVILAVVDAAGNSSTARHILELQPATQNPPSAAISGPTQARVGESLTFDGSASAAGDGSISAYNWNFGDGTEASGRSASHAFAQAGTFHVVLQVSDSNGLSDSTSHAVQVAAPDPPRAVISGPTRTTVGTVVTFDGRSSSSGSPIQRFEWDFGDGGRSQAAVTTWAYQAAGNFTVRLTVRDAAGRSDTASQNIAVEARPQQPPTAALTGPSEATTGSPVRFSAEGSRPGSNPIARYDWTVNGASLPGEGAGFTHTFSTPGVYTVAVLVTDSAGLSDTASQELTVEADLQAVVWVLDGSAPPITMTAAEGNATGSTGCNTFFVGFVATGDAASGQVTMGPISTSQRACAGPVAEQEQAFLEALAGVTAYSIADGRLTLNGDAGSLEFSAQAEGAATY